MGRGSRGKPPLPPSRGDGSARQLSQTGVTELGGKDEFGVRGGYTSDSAVGGGGRRAEVHAVAVQQRSSPRPSPFSSPST
jgi:hypothetical protein